MFSIQFDGHAKSGFEGDQQRYTRTAAQHVANLSQIAVSFPQQNMVRWFGSHTDLILRDNLVRMNRIIQDAARTVTFVQAMGLGLKVEYEPHDALKPPVLKPEGTVVPEADKGAFFGLAYPLNNTDQKNAKTRAHVGSGMRIYLGTPYFQLDPLSAERPQTIYHELSHKILATNDYIYGVQGCLNLARNDASKARMNADSYGYFLISIPGWI